MINIKEEVIVEIPFYDLDPMNIVWHGNYAKYLERARCALLDKIDFNYEQMKASGYIYPVASMNIKYVKSCLFGQKIKVIARIKEYESCLIIKYLIEDVETGEKLSQAETMQVAVDIKTGESFHNPPKELIENIKRVVGSDNEK